MDESQVNKPEQIKHFTLETFKKAFTGSCFINDLWKTVFSYFYFTKEAQKLPSKPLA